MKTFVTGLHRAGTHTIAMHYASKHGVQYFPEDRIKWDSLDAAIGIVNGYSPKWSRDGELKLIRDPNLDQGFVLHCPGLAHKVSDLSKLGRVCWVTRNHEHVVTSMVNAGINDMAWHIMHGFMDEFPYDPIWENLVYDGRRDPPSGFAKYYTLLIKVKEYFYQTRFADIAKRIVLEDFGGYNFNRSLTAKKPIKARAKRLMNEALAENESLRIY